MSYIYSYDFHPKTCYVPDVFHYKMPGLLPKAKEFMTSTCLEGEKFVHQPLGFHSIDVTIKHNFSLSHSETSLNSS